MVCMVGMMIDLIGCFLMFWLGLFDGFCGVMVGLLLVLFFYWLLVVE